MVQTLLVVGLAVAAFVGFNIGGSSTGVAFGPAVGSRIVRKVTAAALFTAFAFVGAWTVGRRVIDTMSSDIVPAASFTPEATVGILFFTGVALLVSNLYGVPASTSMTAVGAIAGLGLAKGTLETGTMLAIVSAWIVAPLVAFFVGAGVGRYLYPYLDAKFAFGRLSDPLLGLDTGGTIPRPSINENAARRDLLGSVLVVGIACYMGFSAGASNAANAVAPLVGSGALTPSAGVLLAVGTMGLGGFTIARRTLATVGDDITDLPILAALIVSTVGATIITVLSWLGIPASLAVSTTCCIIGLGWGRASRAQTLAEMATPPSPAPPGAPAGAGADPAGDAGGADDAVPDLSTGALAAPPVEDDGPARGPTVGELAEGTGPEPGEEVPDGGVPGIGDEDPDKLSAESLFDPAATARIVVLWVLAPALSVVGAYLLFSLVA